MWNDPDLKRSQKVITALALEKPEEKEHCGQIVEVQWY
jgi:hypothetical protein